MSFWAEKLADELSQGDLLSGAWIGGTADPRQALRKGTGKGGAVIWTGVNALAPEQDGKAPYLSRGRQCFALVLSQDCEMDKKGGAVPVLVAPVLALETLAPEMRDIVRQHRRHAFLHLPAVGPIEESYCDLRAISFVPRPVVDELGRVASASAEGELRLAAQVIMFLFRRDVGDLTAI